MRWNTQHEAFFARHGRQHCVGAVPLASEKLGLLPTCGLVAQGAIVRICGSRTMAHDVAETLDAILTPLQLSVMQLEAKERYAEDVF